jgi:hypothetical protein
MYSTSNRETMPREKNIATSGADMNDIEILEKAIVLVKENAPEHCNLIQRLAATALSIPGLQPICGLDERLTAYKDRPETIAKTVLDSLRYKR